MTSLTYGSRGAAQVRLRPAVGHELLRASAAELDRSVAAAHEQVRRGSTAETGATTPQLWSALRAASLGLLDGETSPLAPRRCGQRREVVLEPARVVPAPDSRHVVGAHAAELLELDDGDRALAGWDARGVAAVESRWALLTATGTSGADDEADLARALAEELEQLRAQREVWARSLAWRVAARLGAAADRAVRDRDEALRTLASPTGVDVEAVDRERRHFLWGTSAVVAFVLVVTSGHLGALDWRDHPRVGVALLLGTLLVEGLLVRRYYQEHSALERALALRLHVVRTATTTASHAGREARRLSASYGELMQWAALLAHVVHRPWQLPPRAERPADPDLDASRLPLALAVAWSEEAERGPGRRQRAAATAVVLRPGYLRHAFLGLVARALPDQDRDVAESVQLLDQDSPGAGNGSRRRVLDALTEGAPQRELALEVRDRVARDAVPESADLAGGDVRPVVGPGEPALPCALSDLVGDLLGPAPAFAQALWSSHALVRRQQATGSSVLWAPDWYAAGAASGLEVRPAPGQAQRVVFAAVRCDASVPVPLEDLVLFAPRVAEPPLPVPDQPRGNAWV